MSSQHATPYYMDDFGGRHYPPQPEVPPPPTGRSRYPRYNDTSDRYERRPRRAHTDRAPHPPPSSSTSSSSPPSRREPPRRSPRNHQRKSPERSHREPPRRRRHREEDYFSDDRHDRRHPRGDARRDVRREHDVHKDHAERRRSTRPRVERQESKWQKEGKRFFNEYAVPAIKAEGTKYISKQIGNILAKGVSS